MRSRQGSVLETLRRVQGFLDTNDTLLGGLKASGARKELDDSVAQLTTHAVDQDAGLVNSKGETGRQQSLRVALRLTHMKPIAAIARAKLRDVPEFRSLQLPDLRVTTPRLIAAAGSMAEAASQHQDVFVAAGLPQDFAAQLLAAADALRGSIDGRAANRGRRVGATEGLKAEEKRGRQIVRMLDALVIPALGNDDHLVAEWKSLKRVSGKPGVPAGSSASTKTGGTPAPVPAPVPAPAATPATSPTASSTTGTPSTTPPATSPEPTPPAQSQAA